MKVYIPERGDIVLLDFDPALGHEQKGRRPALILTVQKLNKFGLCYVLPITSKIKGYLTEITLDYTHKISGVILTNQLRTVDWKIRNIEFVERVSDEILDEVNMLLKTMLEL